ncbi:hypothetical protein [Salinirussus salinus]|jgi:hypothetical protein|uniref:hypothetical protein n=1 Tax=Salinirussus salinus TaxID=1198300 RepID=UPI00135C7D87|nr:hypothetical protein [Salinirussus salinus]
MDEQPEGDIDEPDPSDPDATFAAVVDLLESWDSPRTHNTTAARHLRDHLDRGLNDDDSPVWTRDIVERRRGSSSADLIINGEIGVKLVGRAGSADHSDLTVVLRLLAERHNYLAIYWLDTSPAETDHRRNVERGTSTTQLGLKQLEFVRGPSAGSGPTEVGWSRVGLAGVGRPLFVGLLSVLGAGIATWLFVRSSGLSRAFLFVTAGVFLLSVVLGVFLTSH